eukprot:TCONS_00050955-protein
MMTLSIEHFHSTTHVKQVLMSQLQYSRQFMTAIKESLKRRCPWSAFYFTTRKAIWYRPPESTSCDFNKIKSHLPRKNTPKQITKENEDLLRDWAANYTRAVRQRTVRQETTMAKTGTLPHYCYTKSLIEVASQSSSFEELSEPSENQPSPSDIQTSFNQSLSSENQPSEEPDTFDPSSDEEVDDEPFRVDGGAGLEESSL